MATPRRCDDTDEVQLSIRDVALRCRRQWYLFAWIVPLFAIWGVYVGQMAHMKGLDSAYSEAHFADARALLAYTQAREAERAGSEIHRAQLAAALALRDASTTPDDRQRRTELAALYANEVDKDVIRQTAPPQPPPPTVPELPAFRPLNVATYSASGGCAMVIIGLAVAETRRIRHS